MKNKRNRFWKISVFVILFATLAFISIGCASADTIYVPEGGNQTIQQAVDNATAGDTITVGDGIYTENVDVDVANLTLKSENGSVSTIVQAANSSVTVFSITADYVNISGFAVQNATGSGKAGIRLENADHCTVLNISVSNNYYGIKLKSSDNNSISNNNASNNKETGITLKYSNNNIVFDNTLSSNTHSGIGMKVSHNNNITGNTLSSNNHNGVGMRNSNYNTITRNTLLSNNHSNIYLNSSNYNTISDNNASNSIMYNGIGMRDSSYNNITGNMLLSNNHSEIWLNASHNNIISNNNASNSVMYNGIGMKNSNYNNITGNTLLSNNHNGFWMENSTNNTINGNIASNNNHSGICIVDNCTYNNITSNVAFNNSKVGIWLKFSSQNTLTGNNLSNNGNTNIYYYKHNSLKDYDNIIDTTNHVNGLPVYFYFNQSDLVLDNLNTKHIAIVGCTNITVRNNNVSNGDTLRLAFTNNSLVENNIVSNTYFGIFLRSCNNDTINNNTLNSNNHNGIAMWNSQNNTISNNNASLNKETGIFLNQSSYNQLINNTLTENGNFGIWLRRSPYNTLRGNVMDHNGVINLILKESPDLEWWNNDIDTSNTVNDLPVYYIYNQSDLIIDNHVTKDLLLVGCNNVTVRNITYNDGDPIRIIFTNNSLVENCTVTNNNAGSYLLIWSHYNNLTNNSALNNEKGGFCLQADSSHNTITDNIITGNGEWGINLHHPTSNNTISNNYFDNTNNAYDDGNNIWNITKTVGTNIVGGSWMGGNYWSDYAGEDLDGDGLGDTLLPYKSSGNIANEGDYLPLVIQSASISGRVCEADGISPIEGATVKAVEWDVMPFEFVCESTTDANGTYVITNLSAGDYRVYAYAPGFGREFYQDTYFWNDAQPVSVIEGQETSNINFSLGPGGSISGTITSADSGTALSQVSVFAIFADGNHGAWAGLSDENGNYTIIGLPYSTYKVLSPSYARFGSGDDNYVMEFWQEKTSRNDADIVTVSEGINPLGINFTLEIGGSLSGTVLDQNTGEPVKDASSGSIDLDAGWHKFVYRHQENEGGQTSRAAFKAPGDTEWRWFSTSELAVNTSLEPDAESGILLCNKKNTWDHSPENHGELVACVDVDSTEESGWYGCSIVNTVNQNENIHGNDDYYTSYYEGYFYVDAAGTWQFSTDSDDASEIVIDDQVVAHWYKGHGSADRWEYKMEVRLNRYDTHEWVASTRGDADGNYTFENLPPGSYRVEATAPGYVTEFFEESVRWDDATPVVVTASNETTGINFTLEVGGTISGYVFKEDGVTPLPNVHVYAEDYNTDVWMEGTSTDQDGYYTLLLPNGTYRVRACPSCNGIDYVSKWYNDTHNWDEATAVLVTVPNDTPNINFTLEVGGTISGYVFKEDGVTPLPNVHVYAENYDTDAWMEGTSTDQDGYYTLLLPNGTYRVRVCPSCNGLNYVSEWYNDTYERREATAVSVSAPDDTPNINFTLEVGGTISGYVYQEDGVTPLPDVHVYAEDYDMDEWMEGTDTDQYGFYSLVLPNGTYRVCTCGFCCYGPSYASECYDNPVSVTVPNDTKNINFTLVSIVRRETIEGAVADGIAWLAAVQNPDGSWGSQYQIAKTALAVLNLETNATEFGYSSPLDPTYEYSDEVVSGLSYLFSHAHVISISDQTHDGISDNPDTNGNGTGVYFRSPNLPPDHGCVDIYETSIAMMAIAASTNPTRVVNITGSAVDGWTYEDVLQDMVDYLAWAQTDSGYGRGGWNYEPMDNSGDRSDQSNSGWVTLGLAYAEAPSYGFELTIPGFVRSELDIWIDYIQNDVDGDTNDGGSDYTGPDDPDWDRTWVNILKTGNLLQQMAFVGDTATTQRAQNATDYIVRHWNDDNSDPGWRGCPTCYHATYTTMKGLEALNVTTIDSIDWFRDFTDALLSEQTIDGWWMVSCFDDGEGILSTEWALLTLQKRIPQITKPDLTVLEKHEEWVDEVNGTYGVFYTVKNRGNTEASAGHNVSLTVDGAAIEQKTVPVALAPAATYSGSFDMVLSVGQEYHEIMVCADSTGMVDELNEDNNCLSNVWPYRVHNLNTGENFSTIQEAVDASNTTAGHTITVDPETYNENVNVYKSLTIRSTSGNSADTIVNAINSYDHVFEVTADHVNISGFTVTGATGDEPAGILLFGASYCNISENNASDNGYGIWLDKSNNNTLTNNTANSNGNHGIRMSWSNNNTLTSNNASNNEENGIWMENSTNNTLNGNIASNNNHSGICIVDNCTYNNITSNVAFNNSKVGIWLKFSSQNTLTGNNLSNNGNTNIYYYKHNSLKDYDNIIDTTNHVNGLPVYFYFNQSDLVLDNLNTKHIAIVGCTNITVRNNNVSNGDTLRLAFTNNSLVETNIASNNYYGIFLRSCNNDTIRDNILNSNNINGIAIWNSQNNTISNNIASNNSYGILIVGSCHNTFTNNTVNNNSASGIHMEDSSNYNIITDNTAKENSPCGINLYESSNNVIICNLVQDNMQNGFYLTGGSINNNISYNNIIENGNYNPSTGGYEWQFHNDQGDNVDAINNWWGTNDETSISASIYDWNDDPSKGNVTSLLRLDQPAPCAPEPRIPHVFTVADATIALEIAVGSRGYDSLWDVSGDGSVTSLDALMILQAAAGDLTL